MTYYLYLAYDIDTLGYIKGIDTVRYPYKMESNQRKKNEE